jgi:hypothetical protein
MDLGITIVSVRATQVGRYVMYRKVWIMMVGIFIDLMFDMIQYIMSDVLYLQLYITPLIAP